MNLTEHFTLEEMVSSPTAQARGINNDPPPHVVANLHTTAEGLERIRALLGRPVKINSGYRCSELNVAVGGSHASAHMSGLAADIVCPGYGTPKFIAKTLIEHRSEIGFDKIIQEGTWLHVAFPAAGDTPKYEVLTAHFGADGTTYTRGIS